MSAISRLLRLHEPTGGPGGPSYNVRSVRVYEGLLGGGGSEKGFVLSIFAVLVVVVVEGDEVSCIRYDLSS